MANMENETNNVYILLKGSRIPTSDLKSEIYGVYSTKKDGLIMREKLRDYYNSTNQSCNPFLIKFKLNHPEDMTEEVLVIFNIRFDKNLDMVIEKHGNIKYVNTPECMTPFGLFGTIGSNIESNQVEFEYDFCNNFRAVCKISKNISDTDTCVNEKGRTLVQEEVNKRMSCLKDMINHVRMEIEPRYMFSEDKFIFIKIETDDYFKENYSEEAKKIFKRILIGYIREIEKSIEFKESYVNLVSNQFPDNDLAAKVKSECDNILSNYEWYKNGKDLSNGLKEFLINGDSIFKESK